MEKSGYAVAIFIFHVEFRIIGGGRNCQVIISRDEDLEKDFYKFCIFIMCYWVKPWLRLETWGKRRKCIPDRNTTLPKVQKYPDISPVVFCNSSYLHFSHYKDPSLQPELFYLLKILWTKLPGSRSLFLTPLKLFLNKSLDLSVWNTLWALNSFNYITLYSGKFNPTNIYWEPTIKNKQKKRSVGIIDISTHNCNTPWLSMWYRWK